MRALLRPSQRRLTVALCAIAATLLTCGDDDAPAPGSDSGSEADGALGLDGSPPVGDGGGTTGDGATPGDDAAMSGDDGSTPAGDSGGSCAGEGTSCAQGETCCGGLMCCSGVPVPPGEEFCGVTCPRSDRDLKQGFERVDVDEVLDGVRSMEVTRWSYRDAPGVRHLGPMAQDFYAAFGLGETPRNIAPIDAQGAAFAAIQALARRQEVLLEENAALRARVTRLERALRPVSRARSRQR